MDRTILAYSARPGIGGLGHHNAHVLESLAPLCPDLEVFGPAPAPAFLRAHPRLRFHAPPVLVPGWRHRYTWLRYTTGRVQMAADRGFGEWVASNLAGRPFTQGYFLTQIAYEGLRAARACGAFTILDNPNGHIRDFREALGRESKRWTKWPFVGHPSETMVARVEAEYELADRIRVSSEWSRRSLIAHGVDATKIVVAPQVIDTDRFVPPPDHAPPDGPLRLVFVGSFSLGKGFQYLLQAMAMADGSRFQLEMVGATGDPWSRRLFERLKAGLAVTHASGDPLGAYQRGELFVFPTLHDGFGLVVAEAMACGLPVITTDQCGAAELIRRGESGWILPAGDVDALAAALDDAFARRNELVDAGRVARRAVERLCSLTDRGRLRSLVEAAWTEFGTTAGERHA